MLSSRYVEESDTSRSTPTQAMSFSHETMLAFMQMLEERYGGAEAYVKKYCGLTDEDLQAIRSNFVAAKSKV